jgi:acyl carrier protein
LNESVKSKEKLIELITQAKGGTVGLPITDDSHLLDDVGLDSLQLINLVMLVEDEFKVDVDFDSFKVEHLSSFGKFSQFIEQLPRV